MTYDYVPALARRQEMNQKKIISKLPLFYFSAKYWFDEFSGPKLQPKCDISDNYRVHLYVVVVVVIVCEHDSAHNSQRILMKLCDQKC